MKKQDWLTTFVHEIERLRADIPRRDAHRAGLVLYQEGGAAPASAAVRFAAEWDGWVTSFVSELQCLRPSMSAQLCKTIGIVRYTQGAHGDPREAARAYAKSKQGGGTG
jgi:hypothetical protein